MIYFNKLVRDRIPDIIRKNNETPVVRTMDKDEFIRELDRKLDEEILEFRADRNLEELADILEVVYGLCKAEGFSLEDLEALRKEKAESRGAFDERTFLIGKY